MKADEQLKCKDCDWYESCEYYDRRKETSQICKMFNNTWKFVAELEKIKAEITACTQQEEGEVPACINYGIKLSTEIVEKHIAELKGENK